MDDERSLADAMQVKGKDTEADHEVYLGPCASRATPKWWPGFHVKDATVLDEDRKTTRSFDYSHMGFREFDPKGTEFVIEVNEPEKWRIRVEGRALWNIYNYLHQHRLEWIAPVVGNAGRGLANGTPLIERITIQRIEDKPEERKKP